MKTETPYARWLLAGAVVALASSAPAFAQDSAMEVLESNRLQLVEIYTLQPSMTDQWDASWKIFRDAAEKQNWPHTTAVYSSGFERWVVSYMDDFSDVDTLGAARTELLKSNSMQRESERFEAASTNYTSYFLRYQPDLSYAAEGDPTAPYVRVVTYPYKSGKYSDIADFGKRYKAEMERLGATASYQVHTTSIGSDQRAVLVVTSAENNLALAQERAETDALLGKHADKLDRMAKGFNNAVLGGTQQFGMLMPELSLAVDEN